jgi:uncharacterized membrane protein YgaE (UPF0421/DUF939 family)
MKIEWTLRQAAQRVRESFYSILQIVLASTVSFFIAKELLGHPTPLLAVTVTISSLGFGRDTRPGRVLSTAAAMVFGILVSEVSLLLLGQGFWQLAFVLLVATVAGRFVNENPAFAITVAIQAVLVQLLPEPDGGVFTRAIDGTLGGVIALLFTALVPRNPIRLAQAEARQLFQIFILTLKDLAKVLRSPDQRVVESALDRIRETQPLLESWRESLHSAEGIANVSPFYRWARSDVQDQKALQRGMDLATRNLRVLTRRVDYLIRDGKERPQLAELIEPLTQAVELLEQSVQDFSVAHHARRDLKKVAPKLSPLASSSPLTLSEAAVLLLLRPLWVDLAIAAGLPAEESRALLPKVE